MRPWWAAAVFLHERRACTSLLRRNEHGYEQQAEGKRGELTYPHWFCKRLLRRPSAGWYRRVLREGCHSQVDRRNGLWVWVSASTRRSEDWGVLHLAVQNADVRWTGTNKHRDVSGQNAARNRVRRRRTADEYGRSRHHIEEHFRAAVVERVTGTFVWRLSVAADVPRTGASRGASIASVGCASQASNRRLQVSEAADPARIADVARTPP